jgi:hypothetical protein
MVALAGGFIKLAADYLGVERSVHRIRFVAG